MAGTFEAPQSSKSGDFPQHIAVFNALQLLALIILCLTLLVGIFAKAIHRMKTWFLFLGSVITLSISFLLLLGKQTGPQPPLALCMMQAALLSANCPFVASAGFCFVVEIYQRITAPAMVSSKSQDRLIKWLIHMPILLHTVVMWISVIFGLMDLPSVRRTPFGTFCQLRSPVPNILATTLFCVFIFLTLALECYLAFYLIRQRRQVNKLTHGEAANLPSLTHLFIRTTIFTLSFCAAAVMDIYFKFGKPTGSLQAAQVGLIIGTSLPVISFGLVFGTQQEILRVFTFWRPKPRYQPSITSSSDTLHNAPHSAASYLSKDLTLSLSRVSSITHSEHATHYYSPQKF